MEITLRSKPDPAEIPGMLEAMTRRIAAQAAPGTKMPEGPLFRDVSMTDEVRLVTDPSTPLPRSLTWTRSAGPAAPNGKGGEQRSEQRDVKSWTYAWKGAGK